jgi:hypothetical protein
MAYVRTFHNSIFLKAEALPFRFIYLSSNLLPAPKRTLDRALWLSRGIRALAQQHSLILSSH